MTERERQRGGWRARYERAKRDLDDCKERLAESEKILEDTRTCLAAAWRKNEALETQVAELQSQVAELEVDASRFSQISAVFEAWRGRFR